MSEEEYNSVKKVEQLD